jgi:glycerol uptake facilitator-like aquaporin
MYVKYLMVGFLVVFAVSMMIQFCSYLMNSAADLCKEPDLDNLPEQSPVS